MSKWIFLKYSSNTNFYSVQIQNILTYRDNEKKIFFLYLVLALLSLDCCLDFPLVVSGGYSLVAMHRLLIVVASLVAEHRL